MFTIMAAVSLTIGANAQTYFEDDFEGGTLTANNAWTTQVVADPDATGENWEYGTAGGNYARCSNYTGANHILNTWLISPAINLSGATNPTMNFDMTKRFAGDDMIVQISTNYDGSSAPSSATWTDITPLFTLDANTGSWNFVNSGDGDITAYISANTYIAFEYVGGSTDGSTWEVDNVMVQEGGTVIPSVTIYDIQYTLSNPADSPYLGDEVTTYGIVTAITIPPADKGYYIQDGDGAWNGVFVYDTVNTVAIGDSVEITATVGEYYNFTELLQPASFTVVNSGNTLPNPAVVSSNDLATLEDYEGVLVTAEMVECVNDNSGFGLWDMNDGSGVLKADDDCYDNSATLGNWYDVTGVISYTFSEYKINPRTGADIVIVAYAGLEENEISYTIYPNPANDFLTVFTNGEVMFVTIHSVTGAVVYQGSDNKIDVSDLEAGIYTITVSNEAGVEKTEKLIIQ